MARGLQFANLRCRGLWMKIWKLLYRLGPQETGDADQVCGFRKGSFLGCVCMCGGVCFQHSRPSAMTSIAEARTREMDPSYTGSGCR